MKNTTSYILILILGLLSCESQVEKVVITNPQFHQIKFIELKLKENCTIAKAELVKNKHNDRYIYPKENRLANIDSINIQLDIYSHLDNFNDKTSYVCKWQERFVWEHKKKTNILKIERVESKDSINDLELLDYNIFYTENTNYTTIRFLNKKELIKIFDLNNEITKVMESIPVGFVELTRRQDSINTRTITCR